MIPAEVIFEVFTFLKFDQLEFIPLVNHQWNLIFSKNLFKLPRKFIQESAHLVRGHIHLQHATHHGPKQSRKEDHRLALNLFHNSYFHNITIELSMENFDALKAHVEKYGPIVARKTWFNHLSRLGDSWTMSSKFVDESVVTTDVIYFNVNVHHDMVNSIFKNPSYFYSEYPEKIKIKICDAFSSKHIS